MTARRKPQATEPRGISDLNDPAFRAHLAKTLEEAAEAYKTFHLDWGQVALWPTESGIKHMIEKLKA